jgi:flagellar biosynthesis protein FlhB
MSVSLLGLTAWLLWSGPNWLRALQNTFECWNSIAFRVSDFESTERVAAISSIISHMTGFMLTALVIVSLPRLAQVGFLFVVENVIPNWSRIDPIDHLARLRRGSNVARSVWAVVVFPIVTCVSLIFFRGFAARVIGLAFAPMETIPMASLGFILELLAAISVGMIISGIIDYAIRWSAFERGWPAVSKGRSRNVASISNDPSYDRKRRQKGAT